MIQFEWRQVSGSLVERLDRKFARREMSAFSTSPIESVPVALCYLGPDHIPPKHIGPLTHGVADRFVIQQINHLTRQRCWVAEWHQRPAFVSKHLLRIP